MVFFSIFFKFVFKLPPILFFILFEEPFLNDEYFLVILLNLKSFSNPSIFLIWTIIYIYIYIYIQIIFLIWTVLHNVFFPF
jgi:hypothetical protein